MSAKLILPGLVALLPVLCFLAALLYLDSYKLVRLRTVIAVVAGGAVVAGAGFFVNAWLLGLLGIELTSYTHYVGPVVEELLKGLVIVTLIRSHRIGFLVDAAIFGFAVGSGFAVIENLYYLEQVPDAGMGTWISRSTARWRTQSSWQPRLPSRRRCSTSRRIRAARWASTSATAARTR